MTVTKKVLKQLENQCQSLRNHGFYRNERLIASSQGVVIQLESGQEVINFCANNYLGLANHPELIKAAHEAIEQYGYGMASVRFICGTQTIHRELEDRISEFLGTEDTILYSSCFDANGGLFEVITGVGDAIISDELNHASIIDGIRLSKAKRARYRHNDINDLEVKLREAGSAITKIIATDGVFSMDGTIANLKDICDLAGQYNALTMIDDCHAVGFLGKTGRGTHEYHNVAEQVDIITGTLGKALGGAQGGYTSGRKEIINLLRQRSRPYLFSNTLLPVVVATSLKALELIDADEELIHRLWNNTNYFRKQIEQLGFNVEPGEHPIIPIGVGEAELATRMADELLKEGIYVIGFSYPVVPQGQARIRNQLSASHSKQHIDKVIEAYRKVGKALGITN